MSSHHFKASMFVFNIVCVCVCLNYTWGLDWLRMHLMYCAIPVWCNCLVVFLQVIQVEFCVRAWQIKEIPQMILMCMHVYLSFVRCVWVYALPPNTGVYLPRQTWDWKQSAAALQVAGHAHHLTSHVNSQPPWWTLQTHAHPNTLTHREIAHQSWQDGQWASCV